MLKNSFDTVNKFFKDPLLRSSVFNVLTVNIFAIYYSLQLGPERRSYLATIFTVSLVLHSVLMQAPGLRLRSLPPRNRDAVKSLRLIFLNSLLSVPLFLFIVVGYSHTKQAVPIPLLIVGLIYFLGSLLMFVTQELLFHQKNYRRLMLNDYCSAIVLIISFQIFTLVEFSVAVGVLLSFFSSFIFVGSINASILIRAVKDSEPSSWFSRISDKTLTKRKNRFFLQITLFGNFLERGDKMVLVFLVDPSTFAKFTFNIAPFVVLRFVPQLFMKLTLSRRFEDNLRRINFVGMILLYTGFGVVFSIIIGQTLKNLQGGMWFIGFAPLFAFLFYETLRIVYSLILTRDISLGSTEIHHRISRLGMFALPIQFILCLLAAPNNLTIAYFVSASFIASAIVGLAFYRNRLAEDSNSV